MTKLNPLRNHLLAQAEKLETRTVLSGTAVVQPFSNVDYFGDDQDWSVNSINAPEVWAQGYTGEDIVIAVIDTGVDVHHVDLVHNIWTNDQEIPGNEIDDDGNGFVDDVHGWDFIEHSAAMSDASGHGTHVAGTIVAARNGIGATGIAYDAKVMPIRVLDDNGVGTQLDIGAGIVYAVENGADIINMSLGGIGSRRISSAIQFALDEGVLVVAAAGNEGVASPDHPAVYSALYENVLSVGAYTTNLDVASFSNQVGDSGAIQVDAPGVGIYSTSPDSAYRFSSGTSVATPHVSGIAALALSADPSLTPGELRTLITEGATTHILDSDSMGGVNAAQTVALTVNANPAPSNPIFVPDLPSSEPDLPGDINKDGTVDFTDFLAFSRNFGSEVDVNGTLGDIDGNGEVDFADFLTFSRNFGRSLSVSSESITEETKANDTDAVDDVFSDQQNADETISDAIVDNILTDRVRPSRNT